MLRILQGGVTNGDKRELEKASRSGRAASTWIAPKTVRVGDDVVIYIRGDGFFATARIASAAAPRKDWHRRYGAALRSIRLIDPPISLGVIRRRLPDLQWAKFPRSITTVTSGPTARKIQDLIYARRDNRASDLSLSELPEANLAELRRLALSSARPEAKRTIRLTTGFARSSAIHTYILGRAKGRCESCRKAAPFRKADGAAYLEPHHTIRLADDGPDHPATILALCPNCHRRAHHSADAKKFNGRLKRRARTRWRNGEH